MSKKFEYKKKIVILFMIDFLASKYGMAGGAERQLIEKISRLDKRKFAPILFCLQKRFHNEIFDKIECEYKVIHLYSLLSLSSIAKYIYILKFLRKRKVDIIEAFFFDSILISVLSAKIARIPHILTNRRDMGFWYENVLLKILRVLNLMTERIIVNSNAIKMKVIEREYFIPEKIDIIHNGIDLVRFKRYEKVTYYKKYNNVKYGDKIVGIVANFNRKVKRLDLFILALNEVVKNNTNVKFVIVGDGKLKDQLLELSQKLKVMKFLVWTGRQDNPVPYIKGFDIGIICSDSEGFCNAILEYMAAGLPVVATNTGGNPELVEDGRSGFLVPINDYFSLSEKIELLLNNEELALKMGERGLRIIKEKYAWGKKIKEYEKYYTSVMRNAI